MTVVAAPRKENIRESRRGGCGKWKQPPDTTENEEFAEEKF